MRPRSLVSRLMLCLIVTLALGVDQRLTVAAEWTTDATSPSFPIAGNGLAFVTLEVPGALEIVAVFPPDADGVVSFIARTEGGTLAFPYGDIDVLDADGIVMASRPFEEMIPPLLPSGGMAVGSASFGDTDLSAAAGQIISLTAGTEGDDATWRGLNLMLVETAATSHTFTMRNRTKSTLQNLVMYVACFGEDGTPQRLETVDDLPDSVRSGRSFRVTFQGSCPRFVVYAAGST